MDLDGKPRRPPSQEGFLIIRRPWPSMIRTIWGDPERYEQQYWQRIPGIYFTGDAARRDEDGYFWILGRVDDVMNVSGHRLEHHGSGVRAGAAIPPWPKPPWSASRTRSPARPSAASSR